MIRGVGPVGLKKDRRLKTSQWSYYWSYRYKRTIAVSEVGCGVLLGKTLSPLIKGWLGPRETLESTLEGGVGLTQSPSPKS